VKRLPSGILFIALWLLLSACGGGTSTPPTPTLDPVAAQGKRIFSQHCAACHSLSPDKPDAYIVEGFPNAMPNEFGKKLSGEELDALVHFLLTLR